MEYRQGKATYSTSHSRQGSTHKVLIAGPFQAFLLMFQGHALTKRVVAAGPPDAAEKVYRSKPRLADSTLANTGDESVLSLGSNYRAVPRIFSRFGVML